MKFEAPGEFDPYYAWLKVRAIHRPLSAYELLGLDLLEDDTELIREAATRQRIALEIHRLEAPPEVWQQVHRELEEAIDTLLTPDDKTGYDIRLRLQQQRRETPPPTPIANAGGGMPCPKCRMLNPATRKFCGHCGQNLWEPCYRCSSLSMAGERFCGACGADLIRGLQHHLEQFDLDLAKARKLFAECRFDEAIALLSPLTQVEHPKLEEHLRRANEWIKRCAGERDAWKARIESAQREAEEHLAKCEYGQAAKRLEVVPEPLRGDPVAALLEDARSKHAEVETLRDALRSGVNGSLSRTLLEKVSRLLTLRPEDELGKELVERFRERIARTATEKLARQQHEEVKTFLSSLPDAVRDDNLAALQGRAEDVTWLKGNLQSALFVDKPLIALAERLRQHAPQDAEIAKWIEELQRRAALPKDPRRPVVPWMAAPAQSALGYPLEWAAGLPRIATAASLDPSPLVDNPGRFAVACGLAIQGLGKAAIDVNFRPTEKSVREFVGQLSRKRVPHTAWGIDLGSSGLKAVRLAIDPKNPNNVVLDACDLIEHRKMLSQAASDIEERTLMEETITRFLSRNSPKADRICLGIPGGMLMIRPVKLPRLDKGKLAAVLNYEVRSQFSVPINDLIWSHVLFDQGPGQDLARECEAILLAVHRRHLQERLARLQGLGLNIDIVQSDGVALHNFAQYNYGPEAPAAGSPLGGRPVAANDRALILVDVGGDAMNVLVSSPRSIWFRNVGIGADRVNKILVRQLQLTFAQSEEWKRNPAAAPSVSRFYETVDSVFEDYFQEASSAQQAFTATHPGQTIDRILAVGGGVQMHGMLRYLFTRS